MKRLIFTVLALSLGGFLQGCAVALGKHQVMGDAPVYCFPCFELSDVGGVGIVRIYDSKKEKERWVLGYFYED